MRIIKERTTTCKTLKTFAYFYGTLPTTLIVCFPDCQCSSVSSDRSSDKQTRCQWDAQCQPTLPRSGGTISWAPTSGDPWPTGAYRLLPLPTHRSIPSSSRAKWPWVRPRTLNRPVSRKTFHSRSQFVHWQISLWFENLCYSAPRSW